ncbi:transposase [Candidatus Collierbacteria bacterium]|nr:transposase [Candidatus Collierbacteria bacterium]
MPGKNSLKIYGEDCYYHVYNRGVNKRKIFKDKQDYSVFLTYLKEYLLPCDHEKLLKIVADISSSAKDKEIAKKKLRLNNFSDRVFLIAYCLMSNHFHFLIKQKDIQGMELMMRSLMTRYTMYFNKRHGRVGTLFQSSYKAVLIESDAQLLHVSRYIHLNPVSGSILKGESLYDQITSQPSSYLVYLGKIKQDWVKTEIILSNFSQSGFSSYQSFVELRDNDFELETTLISAPLAIDNEDT